MGQPLVGSLPLSAPPPALLILRAMGLIDGTEGFALASRFISKTARDTQSHRTLDHPESKARPAARRRLQSQATEEKRGRLGKQQSL